MPVLALVSNKGGAGKTTLAMNLAAGLGRRASVVLVDADPQGSALQWARVAEMTGDAPVEVVAAGRELAVNVRALAHQHDYVVIDCPPSIDASQSRTALAISGLALVPVLPSPLDLWATTYIAAAVEQAARKNHRLRAALVVNQLEPRTTLSRVVGDALGELEIPVLDARVRRRSVYRNCMLEGRTVYGMGARGRDAVDEMNQLHMEIFPT